MWDDWYWIWNKLAILILVNHLIKFNKVKQLSLSLKKIYLSPFSSIYLSNKSMIKIMSKNEERITTKQEVKILQIKRPQILGPSQWKKQMKGVALRGGPNRDPKWIKNQVNAHILLSPQIPHLILSPPFSYFSKNNINFIEYKMFLHSSSSMIPINKNQTYDKNKQISQTPFLVLSI